MTATHQRADLPPAALGFCTYGQLLDLAAADGMYLAMAGNLAQLRLRYCDVDYILPSAAKPCASCGGTSTVLVGGIPLHLRCADPEPAALARLDPAPGAAAASPGAHVTPRAHHQAAAGHLAAVLDASGLWLPGAASPIEVAWPRHAGEAYALASEHQIQQLWIHPSAHATLGIPGTHGPNPQAPEEHPWTAADGFRCDPPGLAAWVHVQPDEEGARRRALVLTAYETRAPWRTASSGQALLAAVTELAAVMPRRCNYYYSPNATSAAVIRHHTGGKLTVVEAPPPAQAMTHHLRRWSRVLAREEEGDGWLHRYDTNGQQLAVWNVKLGLGPASHLQAPQWTRDCRRIPGYWLAHQPEGWRPDPLLPDLFIPWRRAGEQLAWLPTPYLELLDELGAPIQVTEAWVWETSSAWLEASGKTFRHAREVFTERTDEPAELALATVKAMYTARIGAFSPHAPARLDELVRPDVTDMIISKAMCNDYRRMIRIGDQSGRWPVAMYADAVWYTSPDPDPAAAAPAGLTLGTRLGQYTAEASVPLEVVAAKLGEPDFTRAVEAFLRGPA